MFLNKIAGVFYEETTITLGTGHTQKTQRVKNYCLAGQLDEETVQVSFLGNEGQPTGIVVQMPYAEFLTRYTFEPDFKVKTKEEREHDKHIALAERHRTRGESFTAEMEYDSALRIDPESIKANFGIGTLYMEMGQTDKARAVFHKLARVEAMFEEENKHIFNEFGIELRKANMIEEALDNYLKALEISPEDGHLYFNIARLYFDVKDWDHALLWIEQSTKVDPSFREAGQFAALIREERGKDEAAGGGRGENAPGLRQVDPKGALAGIEPRPEAGENAGAGETKGPSGGEPAPEARPARLSKGA